MIERSPSFKTSDGVRFETLPEAQEQELALLLSIEEPGQSRPCGNDKTYAQRIIKNREAVIDILTTTPTSLPKARKLHGGTKTRKASQPQAENA